MRLGLFFWIPLMAFIFHFNQSYCPIFGKDGYLEKISQFEEGLVVLKDSSCLKRVKESKKEINLFLDNLKTHAVSEIIFSTPARNFFYQKGFLPFSFGLSEKALKDAFNNRIDQKKSEINKAADIAIDELQILNERLIIINEKIKSLTTEIESDFFSKYSEEVKKIINNFEFIIKKLLDNVESGQINQKKLKSITDNFYSKVNRFIEYSKDKTSKFIKRLLTGLNVEIDILKDKIEVNKKITSTDLLEILNRLKVQAQNAELMDSLFTGPDKKYKELFIRDIYMLDEYLSKTIKKQSKGINVDKKLEIINEISELFINVINGGLVKSIETKHEYILKTEANNLFIKYLIESKLKKIKQKKTDDSIHFSSDFIFVEEPSDEKKLAEEKKLKSEDEFGYDDEWVKTEAPIFESKDFSVFEENVLSKISKIKWIGKKLNERNLNNNYKAMQEFIDECSNWKLMIDIFIASIMENSDLKEEEESLTCEKLKRLKNTIESTYRAGPWFEGEAILKKIYAGEYKKEPELIDVVKIIWYFYALAVQQKQPFMEGTFVIEDKGNLLFNFLNSVPGLYKREYLGRLASSHFKKDVPKQFGIDIPPIKRDEIFFPPYNPKKGHPKFHILYGLLKPDIIFIKPETYGIVGSDNIWHLFEYFEPRVNEGIGLQKERIPKEILKCWKKLIELHEPAKVLPIKDVENKGIKLIYELLKLALFADTNMSEEARKVKKELNEIIGKFDNPDLRTGNEVILRFEQLLNGLNR